MKLIVLTPTSTLLRLFDSLLDTVDQVRAACTNIRSEHVTTVTLSQNLSMKDLLIVLPQNCGI